MNPIIHDPSLKRRTMLAATLAASTLAATALADSSVTLSLAPSAPTAIPGSELAVTVQMAVSTAAGQSAATILGAQFTIQFDAGLLEPISPLPVDVIVPNSAGPFTALNPGSIVDSLTGQMYFFVFDPTFEGTSTSGDLVTLRFRVKEGSSVCKVADLVRFAPVAGNDTSLAVLPGAAAVLATTNLPPVNLDHVAPILTVVPLEVTVAADAGSVYGAAIAQPTIGATDNCEGDISVTLVATLADGSSPTEWPSAFPIGTSSVTWTATDDAGNTASQTQTIVVENWQLLDATVKLSGAVSKDASVTERAIRLRAGPSSTVHLVQFLPVPRSENLVCHVGLIDGAAVPVAAGYSCVSAKDAGHSLTAHAAVTDAGARYETTIVLLQGDSNNDDIVDIIDFSYFVLDLGVATPDGRSNFNADGVVNSADFAHISINMLRQGSGCTALDGGVARSRVSLKELRRSGLGELAVADLSGDGWIDGLDIARLLEHGGPVHPTSGRMERGDW